VVSVGLLLIPGLRIPDLTTYESIVAMVDAVLRVSYVDDAQRH